MTKLKKLLIFNGAWLFVAVAAFTGGRFSKPAKVVTVHDQAETKIEYRDRIVIKEVERQVHKTTVSTTTKKPDGSQVTTTTTTADTKSDTKTKDTEKDVTSSHSESHDSKLVLNDKPGWRVGGLVGTGLTTALPVRPVYGVVVERRIIGTVWLGAWGLTNARDLSATRLGLSLALEF